MKKLLFRLSLAVVALIASFNTSYALTIDKQIGWLESAYVTWEPVTNAVSYNVYYTGGGVTDKQIDTRLIRSYDTYFRADALGLAAGTYTLTVKAVNISNVEFEEATTSSLTVKSYDRTGFAFWGSRVPGAYKADGTPKDNAVILYVTEVTKDTLSMTVTGANSNPCVGLQAILDGFKKGKDTRPLIVRMFGQLTDFSYMLNGDIVVENNNNASSYITMEGVGDDATADGWGIRIKNASNIEIRNIGLMNCNSSEGDDVGLQQGNDYIWVHNCDLFYGDAGSDSDQAKGDGALDCKKSNYVTFSYNHFWDTGKSNLLGLSGENDDMFVTYHHNWYDHSDSRHPRIRFYSVHVYNNYYDGNAKYGVGSTNGSSVFVEGNYFRNCKFPILTSMQGSDLASSWTSTSLVLDNDYATFSSEDGGSVKAYNNYMEGQNRFVAYGDANYYNSTTHFDAYVVDAASTQVPSSVTSVQGGNTYNNFDTNSSLMYSYTADSPEDAKTNVMAYAGRVEGGDFQWTFDNAVDDASYAVNTALKAALTSYSTSLVYVQGINSPVISTDQTITLTSGSKTQTVNYGSAITSVVYTWGGTATGVSVSGLDGTGLTASIDTSAQTVTISGTPTVSVSYSVSTSGTVGESVSASGTITVIAQTIALTSASGTDEQTVQTGSSITPIVYTWGGTATGATVSGLDGTGLTASIDATAQTATISGTPTSVVSYTVTTTGTGSEASATGTVTVSDETLVLTSGSDAQTVVFGTAITPIVYTWGGVATGVVINGLDETGLSVVTDATAKTVTISGTPTASVSYTVSTEGSSISVSLSGAITVTNQTLVLTSGSASQSISLGAAITPIVYTWGGIATGATASNLPTGLSSSVDETAQTLTISGTPTETGTYTVASTGSQGTSVELTGTITVNDNSGDMVQNFTENGKTSSYYTINGNLSTSYGSVTYNGLTLTQCLKMESSTTISFTAATSGTLTLVFNGAYAGTITIDDVVYNVTSSANVLTVTLAAGTHTILKKSGATYLFYMSMVYDTSDITSSTVSKLIVYPNPVITTAVINVDAAAVKDAKLYSLSGALVKRFEKNTNKLNFNGLHSGSYLLVVQTENGNYKQVIVKK